MTGDRRASPTHSTTNPMLAVSALLVAAVLYFGVGLSHLETPGLEYDEAYDASIATEFLNRQPLSAQSSVHLFGREWPLMTVEIEGPTSVYLSAVAFALFGISVPCLRVTFLVVGFVTLVLLWILARRWFDDVSAAIAVLLCASAPPFVWWCRTGGHWNSPMLPIALAMMLVLPRGWTTVRSWPLAVGAFLFGLGFTTKILFVWWLAPLILTAWLTLGVGGIRDGLRRVPLAGWIAVALGLLAGLLPFLLHNLRDASTFRFVAANAFRTQLYGHSNLAVLTNLRTQVGEFARLMGGNTTAFGDPPGRAVGAVVLALSVAYIALRCALARHEPDGRREHARRLFLLMTVLTIVPLSTVSTSHIGATYLFVIVPFTWLLIALSLRDGWQWLRARVRRPIAELAVAGLVGLLVFHHCSMNVWIHRSLARTGGAGLWSDAISTLARRLEERYAGRPIIAMDWGFARNIEVLTRGRVRPREVYEFRSRPSPRFEAVCAGLLRDPANVYLFHVPRHTAFNGVWEIFIRTAGRLRKRVRLEEEVYERTGSPNARIYAVEDE